MANHPAHGTGPAALIGILLCGLLTSGAAAAADPQKPAAILDTAALTRVSGAAQVASAFDACIAANVRDEYDRTSDFLAKIDASCKLYGTVRFHGRGDALHGDSLEYDADKQVIFWNFDITDHQISGADVSPIGPIFHPQEAASLTTEQRREVKELANSTFLVLPIAPGDGGTVRTYEGQNGYGAKVTITEMRNVSYAVAFPLGRFSAQKLKLISASVSSDRARELMPNLDIVIAWIGTPPCGVCYKAGKDELSTTGPPTMASPIDIKDMYKFVYAKLAYIRLIDRRDDSVVATYPIGR